MGVADIYFYYFASAALSGLKVNKEVIRLKPDARSFIKRSSLMPFCNLSFIDINKVLNNFFKIYFLTKNRT